MFFEQLNKMLKVFKNSHILLCMLIIAVIFVWQPDYQLHVYAIITSYQFNIRYSNTFILNDLLLSL